MSDKKKSGLLWPALFAAVSGGFLYLVMLLPGASPEYTSAETPDECGNELTAYVMAQAPVKDLLKSPASADFPSFSASGVRSVRTAECQFSISAYVDAQNDFGAQVRTPFQATMTTDGERWSVASVRLSE